MASGDGAAGLLRRPGGGAGPGTGVELAAVLMLTVGSVVVGIGWLVGVVLLWSSRRWSTGEKWLGTLVVPLGAGGVVTFGGVLTARTCVTADFATPGGAARQVARACSGPPAWIGPGLLLPAALAGVVVAVVLYRRAVRRR